MSRPPDTVIGSYLQLRCRLTGEICSGWEGSKLLACNKTAGEVNGGTGIDQDGQYEN